VHTTQYGIFGSYSHALCTICTPYFNVCARAWTAEALRAQQQSKGCDAHPKCVKRFYTMHNWMATHGCARILIQGNNCNATKSKTYAPSSWQGEEKRAWYTNVHLFVSENWQFKKVPIHLTDYFSPMQQKPLLNLGTSYYKSCRYILTSIETKVDIFASNKYGTEREPSHTHKLVLCQPRRRVRTELQSTVDEFGSRFVRL
jgi:hypothetical protein